MPRYVETLPASDRLIVDAEACLGCKTCALVCSLTHEGEFNPSLARLRVAKNPLAAYYIPEVCRQCPVPACLYACPVEGAMVVDKVTGARIIVDEKCVGCGRCSEACLLGMIVSSPARKVYAKCDLCGGSPACVKYCPTKALRYEKRR